jgi:hypothetical protein
MVASVAPGGHALLGQQAQHHLFEPGHVPNHVAASEGAEGGDRVADELPRSMIRHQPAPIGSAHGDAPRGQARRVGAQVGQRGATAQRDHRRVLDQQ